MNPSTALATVIVDELVRGGVREAVLCPGSRNAPLSFALHEADATGRLRLHVRIDERGAGFLGLGLAVASGRPVVVCCTSGTAAANLHPATLEADHAAIPLLLVTADRPPELTGTGANQTIHQAGLFGPAVRQAVTFPVAERGPGQNPRWRSTVCRALAAATGDPPGPVQLDVPFREPLMPASDEEDWPDSLEGRPADRPWTDVVGARPVPRLQPPWAGPASPAPSPAVLTPLVPASAVSAAASVPASEGPPAPSGPMSAAMPVPPEAAPQPWELGPRTLVIAGHGAVDVPPWLAALPTVAEPGSALWAGSMVAGPWLLGAIDDPLRPEDVVVVGRPTLHRPVQRLLADPAVRVTVLTDRPQWTDVAATAQAVHRAAPPDPPVAADDRWVTAMLAADAVAARAVREVIDATPWPTGPAVARDLVEVLPPDSLLVLGSSNAVRDVALAARPRQDIAVHANRGVAGIDGTVSTAVGAALAFGRPAYALLGDLTFLHDATGLVIGEGEPRPDLTIVVLNDRGGGIFSLLEQGAPEHAHAFERVFGTPHRVDLAALCAATGTPHVLAGDPDELAAALAPASGIRVVEVRADRSTLRDLHARLRTAVAEALAGP